MFFATDIENNNNTLLISKQNIIKPDIYILCSMNEETLYENFNEYFLLIDNMFYKIYIKFDIFKYRLYFTAFGCFIGQIIIPIFCIIKYYVEVKSLCFLIGYETDHNLFLLVYATIFFVQIRNRLLNVYNQYLQNGNEIKFNLMYYIGYIINIVSCLIVLPFIVVSFSKGYDLYMFVLVTNLFSADLNDVCIVDIIKYYNQKSNTIDNQMDYNIVNIFNISYLIFIIEIILCYVNIFSCTFLV